MNYGRLFGCSMTMCSWLKDIKLMGGQLQFDHMKSFESKLVIYPDLQRMNRCASFTPVLVACFIVTWCMMLGKVRILALSPLVLRKRFGFFFDFYDFINHISYGECFG